MANPTPPKPRKAHPWRKANALDAQAVGARRGAGRRWTLDDLNKIKAGIEETADATAKPSKYRSTETVIDGMRFDSKLEGRRYMQLKALKEAGEVTWFTRQVPFYLPGGVRYVADFLIKWADGSTTIEDTKGLDTAMSKAKRRIAEAHCNILVKVLKRGDF